MGIKSDIPMKKITILTFFFLISQISFGQLDNVTKNKIKAYYFTAEELYNNGAYSKALDKLESLEELSKGIKLATSQNLKVKILVKQNELIKAKQELEILYTLNPSKAIFKDIASYSNKIDEGIEAEQIILEKKREQERIESVMLSTGTTRSEYDELTKLSISQGGNGLFNTEDVKQLRENKRIARIKLEDEEKQKIREQNKIDQSNWDKTLSIKTEESFNKYLSNSNNTLYRLEAKKYLSLGSIKKITLLPNGKLPELERYTYAKTGKVTEEMPPYLNVADFEELKFYFNLTSIKTHRFYALEKFHENIKDLSKLKSITYSSQKLTKLPNIFESLPNITFLNFYDNKLTSIPKSMWKLKKLTKLNLSKNKLTSISENLGYLKNLTTLDLGHNNISSLPDSFSNLINLKYLHLSKNPINSIPDFIGDFKKLKTLYLDRTNIQNLPENLSNIDGLTIYLDKNLFLKLKSDIKKIQKKNSTIEIKKMDY
ncbi:leucine rich repeat (LRR) protein [Cellulophaga sp. RHA_52]|uniref:Leucine-rich repeat-containing protein n=1 Tax=Cellulophaga lytica (strain ATCC 23178 / DSM 7489 / JCM 8516 / NBRC 14961 / NCIMB 1423 / VKM B-1433 / Cy l20) TaxID=867900 RepID=F0RBC2_CELLC|nr:MULTISPECIES: leucine-rich repeat domain-containing protein [Cellulophaga]ADY29544.1 leucine-rich repeat-containing protein [Cellulophaga lytica DSM 7489]TVZ07914.1 leucine rich repeat (LRR) protein [Cellulophaga sp. RHA_52]WQG76285.1 leucine-rich repeat domain-containing protein [Cellulophaga lytica]